MAFQEPGWRLASRSRRHDHGEVKARRTLRSVPRTRRSGRSFHHRRLAIQRELSLAAGIDRPRRLAGQRAVVRCTSRNARTSPGTSRRENRNARVGTDRLRHLRRRGPCQDTRSVRGSPHRQPVGATSGEPRRVCTVGKSSFARRGCLSRGRSWRWAQSVTARRVRHR